MFLHFDAVESIPCISWSWNLSIRKAGVDEHWEFYPLPLLTLKTFIYSVIEGVGFVCHYFTANVWMLSKCIFEKNKSISLIHTLIVPCKGCRKSYVKKRKCRTLFCGAGLEQSAGQHSTGCTNMSWKWPVLETLGSGWFHCNTLIMFADFSDRLSCFSYGWW